MKVVALVSGGKDSCYNMMQCVIHGHDIEAMANLKPPSTSGKDEIDSFMYQTVGHDAIHMYSECMDVPLYRREIMGGSVSQGSDYHTTDNDETEDLYELLKDVLKHHPDIKGVSVGAILSNYQRVRVEHVCDRLGLTSLAYLWRRDQKELLWEMASAGVNAILIKVAAIGLKTVHLGKSIGQMYPLLCSMNEKYDLHICGEGGEYETFTIDCPLFKKRIVVEETETIIHSDDAFAQVAYLRFKKCSIVDKKGEGMDKSKIIVQNWKECDSYDDITSVLNHVQSTPVVPPTPVECPHPTICQPSLPFKQHPFYAIGGTTAYDSDPSAVYRDIEAETKECMSNIQDKLQQQGLEWTDVVTMNVFVKNMNDFGRINSVYKQFFTTNPSPRALVGIHLKGKASLQIDLTAVKAEDKETMHVQGISYWAPANIGPYSQSVITSGHAFIAGQIGLIPDTLELPQPPSVIDEIALSLRNLENIVNSIHCSMENNVSLCYCYVIHPDHLQLAYAGWNAYLQHGHKPPTLFIAIPSLPRGALVEWQVMLNTPVTYQHEDDEDTSDEEGEICAKMKSLNIYKDRQVSDHHRESSISTINNITTLVVQSKAFDNSLQKTMSQMIFTIDQEISQSGILWNQILSLRVYYCETLDLTSEQCRQLFMNELDSKSMPIPAITAIPVLSIGRQGDHIIACVIHAVSKP